jgi:hypothetical protein
MADHLNARINEKLNEVDFSVITDLRNYFGMTATIIANHPILRKRLYLDKFNTYAKAHSAVKDDEQASIHSKMVSAAASYTSSKDLNFVSTYKRDQKATSQASQSQRSNFSGSHANSGTSSNHANQSTGFSRGTPRGVTPEEKGAPIKIAPETNKQSNTPEIATGPQVATIHTQVVSRPRCNQKSARAVANPATSAKSVGHTPKNATSVV